MRVSTMTVNNNTFTTELECINSGDETGCKGEIEYRFPLSGTGKSFPRCDKHWEERLDTEERLRRDYPETPTPPPWFDPPYAGETWDDDY